MKESQKKFEWSINVMVKDNVGRPNAMSSKGSSSSPQCQRSNSCRSIPPQPKKD